jgi:hypothetical protein
MKLNTIISIALAVALSLGSGCAISRSTTVAVTGTPLVPPTTRDGSKDFDFLLGTWQKHYRILKKIFVHSHDWEDCYGRNVVDPFSDGGGDLETGSIACPGKTLSSLTVRLYNASTHQWSLYSGTSARGLLGPPQVGHFGADGVGIFDAYYTYRGIPTIARYKWQVLSGDHPYFQELYSKDNGRTWEVNWTSFYTRAPS